MGEWKRGIERERDRKREKMHEWVWINCRRAENGERRTLSQRFFFIGGDLPEK